MRFFASSHRLHQLSPRTRLLIALMVGFLLVQAASGIVMQHLHAGWTPASIAHYYRGTPLPEPEAGAVEGGDSAAPAALPEGPGAPAPPPSAGSDSPPAELSFGRELASLVDVAHFHLVFMPIVVFLLAHLFAMTAWGKRPWAGAIGYATFACAALDIATPFLVRYAPGVAFWSWAKLLAFIGLELGLWILGLGVLLGLVWDRPAKGT